MMKRLRHTQSVDEVTYPTPRQPASLSLEDLPRTVCFTLNQGSVVSSMDFHPSHQTLLLVGSANGEITLWEVGLREKLVTKPFKVWDMAARSMQFQTAGFKDVISVSRVSWSPDGSYVGAAFTKHLVHLYAYAAPNELRHHLEIEAHAGAVNDIAFAHPNKQICVVTCGDDKIIKVWDLTGRMLFNFEGHEASVCSVCPHFKDDVQLIFSTDLDGKIKAWLYDNRGPRVNFDAPGYWCTKLLYSADRSRLFSCGTSKEGEPYLVEWNEKEGVIKRTYSGFRRKSNGVVQFDTTQNRFLAAGEDHQIKFWDMDNLNILTYTDAGGGLPNLPRLRFNKGGSLLAVSTVDNGIKILANAAGIKSLRLVDGPSFEATRTPIESVAIKGGVETKPRILEDAIDKSKPWQLVEITDPLQCRLVSLPDTDKSSKVCRLLYTYSGIGILALASNGVQKLWRWAQNEHNPSGQATTNAVPQHWQPNNGLIMNNDVSNVNLEEAVPCIALSKNDSYIMSGLGGKVSLFNMVTFRLMAVFMQPPPAATLLAFHPIDNNVIAIGMDDSTINIYNVRTDEVNARLQGHQKRISGLAFSSNLSMLVSTGADGQVCAWGIENWEKRKSFTIQLQGGKAVVGDTQVQFHADQIRMLVFHESQLAVYDAHKMDLIGQWIPQDSLSAPITYATYSCISHLIFATFFDGNVGVFDADSLKLRCRIAPSAYLSQAQLNGGQSVYPVVVASHTLEPNQFAVGLTDGSIKVIEPSESEGRWGTVPPTMDVIKNGRTASSSATSSHNPDQIQR